MPNRYFLYRGDYHVLPAGEAMPGGAVKVPRLPETGEVWSVASGQFVTDHGVRADMEVPADHKSKAHILKALEASAILSGIPLTHGLLAEEAAALGIELTALAALVAARSKEFRDREVARRITKNL